MPWDQTSIPPIDASKGGWLKLEIPKDASQPTAASIAARPTLSGDSVAETEVELGSLVQRRQHT